MATEIQAPFAGLRTFSRAPRGTIDSLVKGQVAICGAPLDGVTGSHPAVSQGPQSIRDASVQFIYRLQTQGSLTDIISGHSLRWPPDGRLVDIGDFPLYPSNLEDAEAQLRGAMEALMTKQTFPLVLGGSQYITYPLFSQFSEVVERSGGKAGLIQLARSLNMSGPHPVLQDRWHGTIMHRLLRDGRVAARNVALLGAHGYLPYAEWELARDSGVTVVTLAAAKRIGLAEAARQALEAVRRGCDHVYLSANLNVVDPAYAPGCGTRRGIGGMTPQEFLEVLRAFSDAEIAAVDIVEVAPLLDSRARTSRLAAEGAIELLRTRAFI